MDGADLEIVSAEGSQMHFNIIKSQLSGSVPCHRLSAISSCPRRAKRDFWPCLDGFAGPGV